MPQIVKAQIAEIGRVGTPSVMTAQRFVAQAGAASRADEARVTEPGRIAKMRPRIGLPVTQRRSASRASGVSGTSRARPFLVWGRWITPCIRSRCSRWMPTTSERRMPVSRSHRQDGGQLAGAGGLDDPVQFLARALLFGQAAQRCGRTVDGRGHRRSPACAPIEPGSPAGRSPNPCGSPCRRGTGRPCAARRWPARGPSAIRRAARSSPSCGSVHRPDRQPGRSPDAGYGLL